MVRHSQCHVLRGLELYCVAYYATYIYTLLRSNKFSYAPRATLSQFTYVPCGTLPLWWGLANL